MPSIRLESLVHEPAETILEVESGTLTAGRDDDNTMIIDSEAVSRTHGCFFDILGQWFYRDLNSTNGSMINGVKVTPGQIRLLRDGDLIRIADFPVRFRRVGDDASEAAQRVPVLYIFHGDQFETEYPLATPDSRFVIGGQDGHLYLDEAAADTSQAEISFRNSRLEMRAGVGGVPIIVNGMAIGGVAALADRDEIEVGPYRIVVSDPTSMSSPVGAKPRSALSSILPPPTEAVAPLAIQAHPGTKPKDWESEDARRKVMGNRKFIFGTTPEEDEVTGTLSMRSRDVPVNRAEVSAQHRFSQAGNYSSDDSVGGLGERTQMILGALVLILLVAAAVYFVLL